ncbi:MAG: DUF2306 domain-containing protein [Phototrophicaceae bacterium]
MTAITRKKNNPRQLSRKDWTVPILLILLGLVPVMGGIFRMTQLSIGAVTPDNARFFADPIPVVLHIISNILYSIFGAFQFSKGFRLWKPRWHRMIGRVLLPSGIIVALSGLWMSQFYDLPPLDGQFLYIQRLVFGWGMVACLILGALAIRQRKYKQHGAWMIRAYAIALGAGTQVLTYIPWFIVFGEANEFERAMLMGLSWLINIIVAEWIIQTRLQPKKPNQTSLAISA